MDQDHPVPAERARTARADLAARLRRWHFAHAGRDGEVLRHHSRARAPNRGGGPEETKGHPGDRRGQGAGTAGAGLGRAGPATAISHTPPREARPGQGPAATPKCDPRARAAPPQSRQAPLTRSGKCKVKSGKSNEPRKNSEQVWFALATFNFPLSYRRPSSSVWKSSGFLNRVSPVRIRAGAFFMMRWSNRPQVAKVHQGNLNRGG